MLQIQKKYIEYIQNIENELKRANLPESIWEGFQFEKIKEMLHDTELIVPVIGAFSAGKSSLINSFLGSKKLPEKITPETALATELRYSDNERIEAIGSNNSVEKFDIDAIEDIKERANEFKYLKMYLDNDNLKSIEPLVLVDMPGFESPLDLHNQAIMEYINKGVHYIVLTSVEDGTITRSMERQLSDIQEYGREFSFFLSKTNLRSESEAQSIAKRLQEQIEDYFDISKEVVLIDDNGGESLKKILKSINPEKLFESLFKEVLKEEYYTITDVLNTTIVSLGKDKQKNEEVIEELKQSFTKIQKERDQMIEDAYERYSNTNVNKVVESVGRELTNSLDELVNVYSINGQEALGSLISEIVRHALVRNIKDSMSDIGNQIVDDFAVNLTQLNGTMSDFTMSDNWLDKITNTTKSMLQQAEGGLNNIIKNREKSNNDTNWFKLITTVLAVTTNIIGPVGELIVIFIQDIFNGLFGDYKKQKQEEQIRNAILTQTIPSLKRELRLKLPEIFNHQVQEMIQGISRQFEHIIEEKRQTIESTQQEIDNKNIDIQQQIDLCMEINKNITQITNNILYTKETE